MLVVEHPSGAEAEKAQIVLVAINRARKYDVPVESVVEPGERKVVRSEHGGTWNGGANYALKYATAASSSAYPAALTFVRRVVAGEFPNYGYTAFIHPQRMPTPPCAEGRYALQTFDGPRCVPQWARDPTDKVGIAYFYA